jgi:hypothetical protein
MMRLGIISVVNLLIFFSQASGQISLEHSYNYSGTYTRLKNSGDKFFIMDVPAKQCRIYNVDHSLWKVVNLSVPNNNFLYDIKYVSEGLFTSDDRLALAYVYYNYNNSTQVYSYTAKVVTESGQELLSIPGGLYLYLHNLGEQGVKLLAYSYNFSVFPETVQTHIYRLPGQDATKVNLQDMAGNPTNAFPNPAHGYTRVPYKLPDGMNEGEIILMDLSGNQIRSYRVDKNFDHLRIDTSDLPAGVYIYSVMAARGTVRTGKFVVR